MPDVGRSSPAALCRSVLLPEPDGPITAVNVAVSNESVTPRRATTSPCPRPYAFVTDSSWTGAGFW